MTTKKSRKFHNEEYKQKAINLATKLGVATAAKERGINDSPIFDWRSKQAKKACNSHREAELAIEEVELKRQLA